MEFRKDGWAAREGVAFGRTAVDLAAERTWRRGRSEARVWALVRTMSIAAKEIEDAVQEDSLALYWLGADDRHQRTRIADLLGADADRELHQSAYEDGEAIINDARILAPKAPLYVTAAIDMSLIEQWRTALFDHDVDTMLDGMSPNVARCELLHPIVISEALPYPWARLQQTELVGGGTRWLDVVAAEHADDYVRALHRHYENEFTERGFTS